MNDWKIKTIARIHTDFATKFGVPRQSGLVPEVKAAIVFEPEYRNETALRGLEGFSHLWLIWIFSEAVRDTWSPTVRPPRLGGNARMGVFATRSPFRPNPLALSSVKLERIEWDTPQGAVIWVSGADLMDGTPIVDIKPYLAYTDSHPEATEGFLQNARDRQVKVVCDPRWTEAMPETVRDGLMGVLAQDPRPTYQDDPQRVYGMAFGGYEVHFTVAQDILTVTSIEKESKQ